MWKELWCFRLVYKSGNFLIASQTNSFSSSTQLAGIHLSVTKKKKVFAIYLCGPEGLSRYSEDGPGIESLWGTRFIAPVQTCLRAHPASYTMGTGFLQWVNWPESDVNHQTPYRTKDKERVEPYHYSRSGPSWPVIGWPLHSPYVFLWFNLWHISNDDVSRYFLSIMNVSLRGTGNRCMWFNILQQILYTLLVKLIFLGLVLTRSKWHFQNTCSE